MEHDSKIWNDAPGSFFTGPLVAMISNGNDDNDTLTYYDTIQGTSFFKRSLFNTWLQNNYLYSCRESKIFILRLFYWDPNCWHIKFFIFLSGSFASLLLGIQLLWLKLLRRGNFHLILRYWKGKISLRVRHTLISYLNPYTEGFKCFHCINQFNKCKIVRLAKNRYEARKCKIMRNLCIRYNYAFQKSYSRYDTTTAGEKRNPTAIHGVNRGTNQGNLPIPAFYYYCRI